MYGPTYPSDVDTWPRVTSILQACGLIDFSGIPEAKRQYYLDRGTDVHQACDSLDAGEPDWWTGSEIAGYVAGWEKFKADTGFEPEHTETRVWHPTRAYKGRLDRTGRFRDGRRVLVDIKSGVVCQWTRIQTAAYLACLPDPHEYHRFGVQLKADGTYNLPAEFDNYHQDAGFFFSCVNVVHARGLYARCAPVD